MTIAPACTASGRRNAPLRAVAALSLMASACLASSHREAPFISG